jgi:hypothetical protein
LSNQRRGGRPRIVLVAIHPYCSPQAVPLANALLKCVAQQAGATVEILLHDFYLDADPVASATALLAMQPSAVGFSLYSWNRAAAVAIATELQRRAPQLVLFAGGPEPSADPHGLLAQAPLAAAVVGEGEDPFTALCARLAAAADLAGIPGLLLRGAEDAFVAAAPADLDRLPSPWLTKVLDAATVPGVLWELARGCSFACEFCYDPRGRATVRRLPLARVEAELKHFAACGVRQVFVLDSTFNQDLPRAKTILRLIEKLAPQIHFHFEVRSEFLDRELAQLFGSVRCSLQIGLQSADAAVLKNVGRSFQRDDFVKKVGLLNQSGAVFGLDLMIGLPGDTLEGFRQSLDFALRLYPNQLDLFPLAVLPGTKLAARAAAFKLQHLLAAPYTVTSTPTLSALELAQALELAHACDIFYSRGKAVAWFNGVVKALGESPSAFLAAFAAWLKPACGGKLPEPAACNEEQIWQWQRAYLARRFSGKLQRQQSIVLDLLDYHYHYAQALQSAPPDALPDAAELQGNRLFDSVWRLAPSTRIVEFQHDILALLEAGEPQPKRFAELFAPERCPALIFPTAGGVHTEPLDPSLIRLLRQLDGQTTVGALIARLKLDRRTTGEFLRIAAQAGVIVR